MPPPTRQRQTQRPKTSPQEPKTDWRLIEGDSNRVLVAIRTLLEQTGDDFFSVEFRIFESEGGNKKAAPTARIPGRRSVKKKKPGNAFTTFFTRKKTQKSAGRAGSAKKARRRK